MKSSKNKKIIPKEANKNFSASSADEEQIFKESKIRLEKYFQNYGVIHEQAKRREEKIDRFCEIFFRICLGIFVFTFISGLFYAGYYSEFHKKWVQKKSIEIETDMQEHTMGEFFEFGDMRLAVTDVKVLNTEEERAAFPDSDKNLVAVKLSGESDGTSKIGNWLSDAYISYGGFCYWQIPNVKCHKIAATYEIEIFEAWKMTEATKGEGWLVFWLDNKEQEFRLCLEERTNEIAYLNGVHSIDICLEEK